MLTVTKVAIVCFAPLLLGGCLTPGSLISARQEKVIVVDTSCQSFQNITYSKRDTEQTKGEIRAHNRVYDALCSKEPKVGETQ